MTATVAVTEPAQRLLALAVRLRQQHRRRAFAAQALRAGVALALPALAAGWALPPQRFAIAAAFVLLVGCAGAWAAWGVRRLADAALLRADGSPRELDALGDELATWLEHRRRRGGDEPMLGWLARDVEARLPQVPPAAIARVGQRGLGRWRRLVPVVLLVLLVWLIAEWFIIASRRRGRRRQPRGGAAAGGAGAGAGGEAALPPRRA
ncbi:MAG: hypothetical protein KF830_07605 [Planctomycetes bacterium]|nr:hypothetical protein [Planctomycetota bacterium]